MRLRLAHTKSIILFGFLGSAVNCTSATTGNASDNPCQPPSLTSCSLCGSCSPSAFGSQRWDAPPNGTQRSLTFEFDPADGGAVDTFQYSLLLEPFGESGTYQLDGSRLVLHSGTLPDQEYDLTPHLDGTCSLVGFTLACATDSAVCEGALRYDKVVTH
jgi:hypothetical protein